MSKAVPRARRDDEHRSRELHARYRSRTRPTRSRPARPRSAGQTVDLVPLRAVDQATGSGTSYLSSLFQTELEIGLADRLELGLYFTFAPTYQDADGHGGGDAGVDRDQAAHPLHLRGSRRVAPSASASTASSARTITSLEFAASCCRCNTGSASSAVAANLWAEYELYFAKDMTTGRSPARRRAET